MPPKPKEEGKRREREERRFRKSTGERERKRETGDLLNEINAAAGDDGRQRERGRGERCASIGAADAATTALK